MKSLTSYLFGARGVAAGLALAAAGAALVAACSSTETPAGGDDAGLDTSFVPGLPPPAPTTLPDGAPRPDAAQPDGALPEEDGGPPPPPGLDCSGAAGNAAGAATIEGYMDSLPSPPAGATRTAAVDSILRTCEAFGPPPGAPAGWAREHCWAFLAASIAKESNYNPAVLVRDAYATRNVGGQTANDPVVGLLQIRFSSTVHEVAALASKSRLTCAGCTLPAAITARASEPGSSAFWAVTGPTQHMAVMKDVACNVAMGAWFYFVNATGNGKASAVTYPDQYCAGGGTGGTLITGLLSHLKGSEAGRGAITSQGALNALQGSDPGGYGYVTQIKGWFDTMVGPSAGTHPFFLRLAPDPAQYCE